MKWLEYSLISAVTLALVSLGAKYLLTTKEIKVPVLLFFAFLSGAIIIAVYAFFTKQPLNVGAFPIAFIVGLVAVSLFGNFFYFTSINIAPNPGYAAAVASLSTLIITVLAIFLFKSELTFWKSLGVVFAILSVVLLGLK